MSVVVCARGIRWVCVHVRCVCAVCVCASVSVSVSVRACVCVCVCVCVSYFGHKALMDIRWSREDLANLRGPAMRWKHW